MTIRVHGHDLSVPAVSIPRASLGAPTLADTAARASSTTAPASKCRRLRARLCLLLRLPWRKCSLDLIARGLEPRSYRAIQRPIGGGEALGRKS